MPPTEIYPLSLHDALPIFHGELIKADELWACTTCMACVQECPAFIDIVDTIIDLRRYLTLSEGALPSTAPQSLQNIQRAGRSEEHTSELQSHSDLVCRLLL